MRTSFIIAASAFLITAIFVQSSSGRAEMVAAETGAVGEQNLRDFDFMVDKISTSYAGFDTKTAGDGQQQLAALTKRLREKAATASNEQMSALMIEWIGFFGDKHTQVSVLGNSGNVPSATSIPRKPWTEISVLQNLRALGNRRHPLEGVWSIDGDRYRLGVLRDGSASNELTAVVLSAKAADWSSGMVKANLQANADARYSLRYRTGNFAEVPLSGSLKAGGAVFDIGEYGVWNREWPAVTDPIAVDKQVPASTFFFRRLSPSTVWFRIPNFHDDNAALFAKLLKDNARALGSTDNLIIDARRNGGGSDFVYSPLMPYLYTRPIYSIGAEMRASADNIALRKVIADELRKNPEGLDSAKELDAQNAMMAKNLGGYVLTDPKQFWILNLGKVLPFPKRIVILIDGAGSSGEEFLLTARQSGKVTLMGQSNSEGVLDFANVVSMPTPSGRFEVQWATSRSLRLPEHPVDAEGIAPDVRIPATMSDPVTFAQNWLERGGR